MRHRIRSLLSITAVAVAATVPAGAEPFPEARSAIDLGERPRLLVESMPASALRDTLAACDSRTASSTRFSIAHRGAPLGYPEHTREGYVAAARQGAGLIECDVTFTRDARLVCRHAQCDLHKTTDILTGPLADRCVMPFRPAEIAPDGTLLRPASARCCTSDLSLDEFLSLTGKRDGFEPRARTPAEFVTAPPRGVGTTGTDAGQLLSHRQSIQLIKALGAGFVPELKMPDEKIGFADSGLEADSYARMIVSDYRAEGIPPEDVRLQSFDPAAVRYWLDREPEFGAGAVLLDGRYSIDGFDHRDPATWSPDMEELRALGVRTLAPPMWMLLTVADGRIAPSRYARAARAAGLELLTWTLERPGSLSGGGGWYYQTIADAIRDEGDVFTALNVLAREVGVRGVFTDWPATVTFYENCTTPVAP